MFAICRCKKRRMVIFESTKTFLFWWLCVFFFCSHFSFNKFKLTLFPSRELFESSDSPSKDPFHFRNAQHEEIFPAPMSSIHLSSLCFCQCSVKQQMWTITRASTRVFYSPTICKTDQEDKTLTNGSMYYYL